MPLKQLIIITIFLMSCDTGKLNVVADIPNHLKEVSAVETTTQSDLMWVIEDAGNDNHLYALDTSGNIKKDLTILNSENIDWEDLTSDKVGNIYIGDFGNNNKKRYHFTIYKVTNPDNAEKSSTAEKIGFKLPENIKSRDFEAFFLMNDFFYVISKESNKFIMVKVPNKEGEHEAELISEFKLEGKYNRITSADISEDGNSVVLLNHDKVWLLTEFESDRFFEGKIEAFKFGYDSQKEGVCFSKNNSLFITEESNGAMGSNIYHLDIN